MNRLEKDINYPCTLTIIVKPGKSIITCSRKNGNELFIDTYEIKSLSKNDYADVKIKFIK